MKINKKILINERFLYCQYQVDNNLLHEIFDLQNKTKLIVKEKEEYTKFKYEVLKSMTEIEVFHLTDEMLQKINVKDKAYRYGSLVLYFYKNRVAVFSPNNKKSYKLNYKKYEKQK